MAQLHTPQIQLHGVLQLPANHAMPLRQSLVSMAFLLLLAMT